jgi:hypothetical protein
MNWNTLGREACGIAFPLGVCLGASFVRAQAWRLGSRWPQNGYMPCYVWSFLLLMLAWLSVVWVFRAGVSRDKPGGVTVADVLVCFLTVVGCIGCYPLWPIVLCLLTMVVVALVETRKGVLGPAWKPLAVRAAITGLLFVFTWYQCATTRRQALRGFAHRIETLVGEDRLLAWASEQIAAAKAKQKKLPDANRNDLKPEEIPDFVHDLMGGVPARTRVVVQLDRPDPSVAIFNSSQEAFRVTVRPSRQLHEYADFPPHWWVQETAGVQWRPGIYLDTAGNFR